MANQFLENEKTSLEDKITKAREGNNENTYKIQIGANIVAQRVSVNYWIKICIIEMDTVIDFI